ncbi:patatin-like phospholipase family protein [Tateyamaria sp. SN6-1]|uniref:patatin-like phospholipase family protein n=1 Tax=Tateyamaria sp. SN6-1 TaxID=3092148 RepID=UPI0039F45560
MNTHNSNDELLGMLRAIDGFAALDAEVLQEAVTLAEVQNVPRGDALIREGDTADRLYLVISGRFTVFAGALAIAEIRPGEPVGELAFFAGGKRTASVIAARDSSVLCLTRDDYDTLSARTPALANGILAALSQRLARTVRGSPGLRPSAGQVCAVLPGANMPLASAFVDGLRDAFSGARDWKILDETSRPETLRSDLAETARWVRSMEAVHDTLLLICTDADGDPVWRKAVTNNADTIVIAMPKAAQFGPLDVPSALERQVYQAKMEANVQLVLYRDTESDSRAQTVKWLNDRMVGLHHHVALDQPQDFGRLGRFIRGEAVGLVLCGGGSFGTAHLGGIKYLQENGYHFDYVGGTSVGSAMAGALAMGLGPDHVMEQCEDIFIRSKAMSKITLPRYSLLDHHTLDAAFLRHYGTQDIEDLPLNFFAVATSLTDNDVRVMRTGPLWRAIRASTAIPGIFPPMLNPDGEVLIDGSLIDNVPIEAMRQLKPGPNIILNFLPDKAWRVRAKYEDLPNRAQVVTSLLSKRKKGVPRHPTAFTILARSMVVNARKLLTEIDIEDDVLLNLSVLKGMSFLDWKRGRELFNAAYQQMDMAMARADEVDGVGDAGCLERLKSASEHINEVGDGLGLTTR